MPPATPSFSTPSYLLLCINYHSEEAVSQLVRSVQEQRLEHPGLVYIIDNSPDSPNHAVLSNLNNLEGVCVIDPGENLGYFGGAAYGLEQFLKKHKLPEWIIVSNPDIELDNPQFFQSLFRMHRHTKCAVVAPQIASNLTGADQNPFMVQRPSKTMMAFRERIARSYFVFNAYELLSHLRRGLRGLLSRSKTIRSSLDPSPRPIYAPHGSFFIFKRDYFDAGGHLNYEPFLYYEENFVAEMARRLGLSVLYDPRLRVVHYEHVSTGFFKSRRLVKIIHQARTYFLHEYYNTETTP